MKLTDEDMRRLAGIKERTQRALNTNGWSDDIAEKVWLVHRVTQLQRTLEATEDRLETLLRSCS